MINELSEADMLKFADRKESELEKKVRKLEQDMMELESILNKEKLVRNKSLEYEKLSAGDRAVLSSSVSLEDGASNMGKGDGPNPWQVMPIHIYRNSTSSQVQPAFFFTWDSTPYDFHNNSAQRSIYTLLDQWQPDGHPMSAEQFKKQLSALLVANKEPPSTTDLTVNYFNDLDDIKSSCEKIGPITTKTEPDIKKVDLDVKNSHLDMRKPEPDLETREILANLEKKLKEVESKCRDDYVKVMNPFTGSKTKTEEQVDNTSADKREENDQDDDFIDDLIFEMFKDSHDGYSTKPIELAKEVDDLHNLIKSRNEVGDPMFLKLESKK